ncbi:MAG: hypothetical protein O2901_16380, partial [Verrucomicrobia bacterium]|nr:hypothetical protein [Verrucomicrobiota bacterium]
MTTILRSKLLSIFLSLFAFASVAYPQAEKTPGDKVERPMSGGGNPLASSPLAVKDWAVGTVRITDLSNPNDGEGTYGATQNFGATIYNTFHKKFYTVANNGSSAYLYWSKDGIFWSEGIYLGQHWRGYFAGALGFNPTNGDLFAIYSIALHKRDGTVTSGIIKSTDQGLTWSTPTPIPTNPTFISPTQRAQEFTSLVYLPGETPRFVSSYTSDFTPKNTGLFFFDVADPSKQSNFDLNIGVNNELPLFFDADKNTLVGILRNDTGQGAPRFFKMESPFNALDQITITQL